VTWTPLLRSKGQRSRSPGRFAHSRVGASDGCNGVHGNVLAMGNYCYVAFCSAAQGASAPTGVGEEQGHIVVAACLQLVIHTNKQMNGLDCMGFSIVEVARCSDSSSCSCICVLVLNLLPLSRRLCFHWHLFFVFLPV